jgi:hypothetical protein
MDSGARSYGHKRNSTVLRSKMPDGLQGLSRREAPSPSSHLPAVVICRVICRSIPLGTTRAGAAIVSPTAPANNAYRNQRERDEMSTWFRSLSLFRKILDKPSRRNITAVILCYMQRCSDITYSRNVAIPCRISQGPGKQTISPNGLPGCSYLLDDGQEDIKNVRRKCVHSTFRGNLRSVSYIPEDPTAVIARTALKDATQQKHQGP